MIEALRFFEIYTAVNLHFNSGTYDYFKYQGSTNITEKSFLKRNDKYFFQRTAKGLNDESEALGFCVANIAAGKKYIRAFDMATYRAWVEAYNSIEYKFYSELVAWIRSGKKIDKLIEMVHMGEVSKETLIIFDCILGGQLFKKMTQSNNFIWSENKVFLEKYTPFLKYLWNIDDTFIKAMSLSAKKAQSFS